MNETLVVLAIAAQAINLLDPTLREWDKVGDGMWSVMRDGTLVGQRSEKSLHQAWLYTKREFGEYDLHLEWWCRQGGNSGVSIRDTSRGRFAVGEAFNRDKTPSHIGYEIQISEGHADKYPTGSIYLFDMAKKGRQIPNDWNALDIEVRDSLIRVLLNGQLVSQHAGDPARSKAGPIGLQLHDPKSLIMFRKVRVREIKKK
ncbi:MAG: 3-keto-disaccharide hydrolase [Bryobacteraceae bacterium]